MEEVLPFTVMCYTSETFSIKAVCSCRAVVLNLPNVVSFNTIIHVVETPMTKLFSLRCHNCFATIVNHNVNISVSDEWS